MTNWVELHTYGTSWKCLVAGCGILIRGCDSNWTCGFAKCIGCCNAYCL